jgi:hypothetical protein
MTRKILSSSLRTNSRETDPGAPIHFPKVRVPHSIALARLGCSWVRAFEPSHNVFGSPQIVNQGIFRLFWGVYPIVLPGNKIIVRRIHAGLGSLGHIRFNFRR